MNLQEAIDSKDYVEFPAHGLQAAYIAMQESQDDSKEENPDTLVFVSPEDGAHRIFRKKSAMAAGIPKHIPGAMCPPGR